MTTAEHIDETVLLGPEKYDKKIVIDAGVAGTYEVAGVGILKSTEQVCIYAGAPVEE